MAGRAQPEEEDAAAEGERREEGEEPDRRAAVREAERGPQVARYRRQLKDAPKVAGLAGGLIGTAAAAAAAAEPAARANDEGPLCAPEQGATTAIEESGHAQQRGDERAPAGAGEERECRHE